MLDENLPTFFARPSSDSPQTSVVYFTQNGAEPVAEYLFKRPHPLNPKSHNKFALWLEDAHSQDVIYSEVVIEPEWQQPTLSAAEIRALNGATPASVPMIPDAFTIQLYNPDQQVAVRGEKSTWTGKESFEFEMPQQSFRMPSASKLDRQQSDPVASDLTPKIMFRWKRDSKFSKDMTCYMCGKSLGGKKSKEPDITVALYKQGRESALTIYEPNLQRVEVEDRKGLELVLVLGAEVIREIYLFPSRDSFNINGAAAKPANKRKNSKPLPIGHTNTFKPATPDPYAMSGGLGNIAPAKTSPPITQLPTPPLDARRQNEIDAETKRLQEMVAQEERRERERRDKEEQKRIKKMLEDEEKERRRREAEVAKETELLRKQYGMEGQDFANRPALPPRPSPQPKLQPYGSAYGGAYGTWNGVQPPARPVSVGPSHFSWLLGGGGSGAGPSQHQPSHHGFGRPRGGSDASNRPPKMKTKKSVFF